MIPLVKAMSDKLNYDSRIEVLAADGFTYFDLKPEVHHQVGIYFIDFAFPDQKFGIEIDGKAFHSTPLQLQKDAYRQKYLKGQGWKIRRYPGWLVWRHRLVPAAEFVIRFMKDPEPAQLDKAHGIWMNYIAKTHPDVDEVVKLYEYEFSK